MTRPLATIPLVLTLVLALVLTLGLPGLGPVPAMAERFERVVIDGVYYRKGFFGDPKVRVISKNARAKTVRVIDLESGEVHDISPKNLLSVTQSINRDFERASIAFNIIGKVIESFDEPAPPRRTVRPPARTGTASRPAPKWTPGRKHTRHKNVVAAPTRNSWRPANGYRWVDRHASWATRWTPGVAHPVHANLIASKAEGKWRPRPGYAFVDRQKSVAVRWQPGTRHPEHAHVLSLPEERKWAPAPGYNWVDAETSWDVVWTPFLSHPEKNGQFSATAEGEWIDGLLLHHGTLVQRHAARNLPRTTPPDVTGRLFAPEDYDLYVRRDTGVSTIFHAKIIPYHEIDHLEFHYDHTWVVVVMTDGRRLDLGGPLPSEVITTFREAETVSFGRTKDGTLMEEAARPLVTLAGDNMKPPAQGYVIGIAMRDVTRHDFKDRSVYHGVTVQQVAKESPAEAAGLQPGDILLSVDGAALFDGQHLKAMIAASGPRPFDLTFARGDRAAVVSITPQMR